MRLLNRTYLLIFLSFSSLLSSILLTICAARIFLSPLVLNEVVFYNQPIKDILKKEASQPSSNNTIVAILRNHFLSLPLKIQIDSKLKTVSFADVGFDLDTKQLSIIISQLSKTRSKYYIPPFFTGNLTNQLTIKWPVIFNENQALVFMKNQKQQNDKLPSSGRFDNMQNKILAPKEGNLILPLGSVANLYLLLPNLRNGTPVSQVIVDQTNTSIGQSDTNDIDVSYVLASVSTKYFAAENDRTKNIKKGAQQLNGYVLQPGQTFSFNTVVGPRTTEYGYSYASVIMSGELLSGEAGGMCQNASTLHWAAVMAGLKIKVTRPHSRPSAYIDPGLDSTVVYPDPKNGDAGQDLQFINNYDFPIVLSVEVGNGEVQVKILGQKPPIKGIIWSREVKKVIPPPIEPIKILDPNQPKDSVQVSQPSHPGYEILIVREIVDHNNQTIQTDKFLKYYPPTQEAVVIGTGSPKLPIKKIKIHKSRSIPDAELPVPEKATIPHQIVCRFKEAGQCETIKDPAPLIEKKAKMLL